VLRSRRVALAALAAVAAASAVLGTLVGSVPVDWGQAVLAVLQSVPGLGGIGGPVDPLVRSIVVDLRLPRVLLAAFVGAALGVGGAAMQALLRNPLADPYIFGVSSGAAVGSAAAIALGFSLLGALSFPAAAFLGAILATLLVYQVARSSGRLPAETMLLAGLAIGSLLAAVASFIVFMDARRHVNIIFWMLGSFDQASWDRVGAVALITVVASLALLLQSRPLNAMLFGDESAAYLGIEVERFKVATLFLVALLTAGAVAFAGIIGFVGVIVPHAMRLVVGPDHRHLVPASALFGGALLVTCDLVARSIMPPTQVPVGILTAFLGAPFFVYLLRRSRGMASWG
jgi:iron complex transport system permease protein